MTMLVPKCSPSLPTNVGVSALHELFVASLTKNRYIKPYFDQTGLVSFFVASFKYLTPCCSLMPVLLIHSACLTHKSNLIRLRTHALSFYEDIAACRTNATCRKLREVASIALIKSIHSFTPNCRSVKGWGSNWKCWEKTLRFNYYKRMT